MNPYAIFKEFFRREGIYYLIGLTMLIAIDVAFLIVPQLIGSAIDTLSHNKEGLTHYILYFIGLLIIITILKVISRRTLLGSIRRMEYLFRQKLCARALEIPTTYYDVNGPGKVMALMTNDVTSLRVALGLGVMIVVDIGLYHINSKNRFYFILKDYDTDYFYFRFNFYTRSALTKETTSGSNHI